MIFKLEFTSPKVHGDATICKIEVEDISLKIEYLKNAVVCYVLGAFPPFNILNSYIPRSRGKYGINKVSTLRNEIVLARFDSEVGKNEVIEGGIYHFDNKPFIVKAWTTDMEFVHEELYIVFIWIRLPGLDSNYWSPKGLSKIGSLVGKPLMVDKNIKRKTGSILLAC